MPETIREWAERYCIERGMFADRAKTFITDLARERDAPMICRWDDDMRLYHYGLAKTVPQLINPAALAWIDAHCPGAWFRKHFEVPDA